MLNSWDDRKNELLKADKRRGKIGFEEVQRLFNLPYYEDVRGDDPLQFFAIGWVNAKLYTLVYEIREDNDGPYRHLITFWPSTKQERKFYG